MIIIEIKNAKEVAAREKGRLKVFFAALFGVDIAKKVEEVVAERIIDELRRKEIEAEVRIESTSPSAGPVKRAAL
jgi:predicted nucleic acid-binding OB-fold protein